MTTPVEARLVAFPYVICHTGRSPVGTICSGCPPVHTGNTASKLRISLWMNRTRGSLHYRRYTGRSPVSTSFWAPPVRTGGAAGGSISSDQPSLGLNPRIIAVTPVEARLTKLFFLCTLLLSMLMNSAKRVEKRCSGNPTQISLQTRPTPVEARLKPPSQFRHHTGRSPVDVLFSQSSPATPVEARLVPRHSGRNPVDTFLFLPRR